MMPHYNRGKAELAEREAAEQALVATGYSDESLLAYVHLEEQKSKDLQRIRCIFERVATVRCLDPGLWDYYIVYLVGSSAKRWQCLDQLTFANSMSVEQITACGCCRQCRGACSSELSVVGSPVGSSHAHSRMFHSETFML